MQGSGKLLEKLTRLDGGVNAYTCSFDNALLDELRTVYDDAVRGFLKLPSNSHLLEGGKYVEAKWKRGPYRFHASAYDEAPLLWVSSDDLPTYDLFKNFFHSLGITADVAKLVDVDRNVTVYCGFFVVGEYLAEAKWHVDYFEGANAFTLIAPLFDLDSTHGNLLYRDNASGIRQFRYRSGEAIVLGEGFSHTTEPYPRASSQRVLVSLTFGTDKLDHWSVLRKTAARQSDFLILPCGHQRGTCTCWREFRAARDRTLSKELSRPGNGFGLQSAAPASEISLDALITALLRGERAPWPFPGDVSAASRFLSVGRSHGVLPLLGHHFANSAVSDGWPAEVIDECRKSILPQAAIELARRAEMCRVFAALHDVQVRPLVLKGGALAYTHYPNPVLRPRGDTDLLIAPSAKGRTDETLRRLGYTHGGGMAGNLVSYQASWSRVDGPFAMHHLDVHWRINNSQILANLLTYDELEARATGLPMLGPHARGLSPVHAMLVACMHRAGHRNAPYYVDGVACPAADRLIWIYDIHLLYSRMSETEIAEFVELAATKRVSAICHESLEASVANFATVVAPEVLRQLAAVGRAEPSALYLTAGPFRQMLGELIAIGNLADRVRWLREIAFPTSAYMRVKYPDAKDTWLPMLYARRGVQGLWRLAASRRRERAH